MKDHNMKLGDLAKHTAAIFEILGYDQEDVHMKDSPERIAKYLLEWHTQGREPPKLTTFPNEEKIDEMIVVRNIPFYALCAHHGVHFSGHACIAYIPREDLLGLSKFARVADHFAHRFTVQERLTKQVSDFLFETLKPKGLAVILEAEHLCMSARGVAKPGHCTTTSDLRGNLKGDSTRAELLALMRNR